MKTLIIIAIALLSASSTFAQNDTKKDKPAKNKSAQKVEYTCSMHPEVVSNKPGKCPKCSMQLTASKKEQMKQDVTKLYTCPMHPEVQSSKPGKCPKCQMALTESKSKMK